MVGSGYLYKNMTTVIYVKETKEVLAVLCDREEKGFMRKDLCVKTFEQNEPTFSIVGDTIFFDENTFTVHKESIWKR